MTRLTIVVDVPDADRTTENPEEVADQILDDGNSPASHGREHRLVYAEWGETLRGNPGPG